MIDTKELRRLAQAARPEEVAELLARLESAESEVTEQARLNGAGAERELALMAKLEAAEKERDELLAKIEAMEKQEPVAEWVDGAFDQYPHLKWKESYTVVVGAKLYTKLYPAPGAQPAQVVPEAVMEVIAGLVYEIERQTCTHEETHRGGFQWEICDSCGAKWADDEGGKPEFEWPEVVERAWAMLAAAPGAKGEEK